MPVGILGYQITSIHLSSCVQPDSRSSIRRSHPQLWESIYLMINIKSLAKQRKPRMKTVSVSVTGHMNFWLKPEEFQQIEGITRRLLGQEDGNWMGKIWSAAKFTVFAWQPSLVFSLSEGVISPTQISSVNIWPDRRTHMAIAIKRIDFV